MPKIEVHKEHFFALVGKRWNNKDEFEAALTCAKAELDEGADATLPPALQTIKIELNDTNRPDLWSAAGCARQLRVYHTGNHPYYPFFSAPGSMKTARRSVRVDASVQNVRPFLAGFIARGRKVSDPSLRDIIQTQEKLAWNYGRKRKTISMGVYRADPIKWPIHYKAVDPDSISFIPLGGDSPLTLREILAQHPKGQEYAWILKDQPLHPLLVDSADKVLSYPPIINSADIGAVQVGDENLFIELTGTDIYSTTLSASIVACSLADQGYEIEPVEIRYDYDTPFSKRWTSPFYFQNPVFCSSARIERFLGEPISAKEAVTYLERMGCSAEKTRQAERGSTEVTEGVLLTPPPYRNDFLHAADVMEDVMIGRGLTTFTPTRPGDFTIGRLSPETLFTRKAKSTLVGLGYQEMIYNYLGSRRDLVERMCGKGERIIRISNPMSENYEYVRDSVLACLCESESVSARAAYPHKIFEIGKVVYRDDNKNYGCATRQYVGMLHAGAEVTFNTIAAELQTLFYYLSRDYTLTETEDPRFIPGRVAAILHADKQVGVLGELHPQVLENWAITTPCTACEFDLDVLISG
jgi:phenylalanyl-tRNA synthetase beta chain